MKSSRVGALEVMNDGQVLRLFGRESRDLLMNYMCGVREKEKSKSNVHDFQ